MSTVEYRAAAQPIPYDLAHHIQNRCEFGRAIVITDRPIFLLNAIRHEWKNLQRSLGVRRATLPPGDQKTQLTYLLRQMNTLSFSISDQDADIFVATSKRFFQIAPRCKTVYLCTDSTIAVIEDLFTKITTGTMLVYYGELY